MTRQRGLALIVVLWATALVTLLGGSFALTMRAERELVVNLENRAKARALAEAAVYRGILALLHPDPDAPWPTDGTPRAYRFGAGHVRIAIRAESGKVNLNRAPPELIEGLLAHAGAEAPGSLAAAVLDWRDANSVPLDGGAEDDDYKAHGRRYGAADGPFTTVGELARVLGMPREVAIRAGRAATVFSSSAKVDASTASRDALMSLPGANAGTIDAFLAERDAARDGGRQVSLHLLSGISAHLAPGTGARGLGAFAIDGEGQTGSGVRMTIRAIIRVTRQPRAPYQVLAWREGRTSSAADSIDARAGVESAPNRVAATAIIEAP